MRPDQPKDEGCGRHLFHVHRRPADLLQPLLHRRLRVRRGEARKHLHAATYAVEKCRRTCHKDRGRRAGFGRQCVHRNDPNKPENHPLLQHVLRVPEGCLSPGDGPPGDPRHPLRLQHRQPTHDPQTVLCRRTLRLPAQLRSQHRPAIQTLYRLRNRRGEGQQRPLPRGDDHHHGGLHQQDAKAEGRAENDPY